MPFKNIFKRIAYEKSYRKRNANKLKHLAKAHYKKDREKYLNRSKVRRQTNPELAKELDRLYYQRTKSKVKERMRRYYRDNAKKINARVAARKAANPLKVQEQDRKSYAKHRLKRIERRRSYWLKNRTRFLAKAKEWRKQNPEKIKAGYIRYFKQNPEAKIAAQLRSRLNKILGSKTPRELTVFKMHGCSYPTLRRHIEKQFKAGMSWDNRGKVWHVDHIIPISLYENKVDANHFSNLRPMFAHLNLSRGNRLSGHFVIRGKRVIEHTL